MNRKSFIKQLTGGATNIKKLLLGTLVIAGLLLFIKADLSIERISPVSILKIVGSLLLLLVLLTLLALIISNISKRIEALLPPGILNWFNKYGRFLNYLIITILYVYVFFLGIEKKKYYLFIIPGILVLVSLYRVWEARKKQIKDL